MDVRLYGTKGPDVVVVHGGPGALDSTVGLARELGRVARVREPVQEASTVAGHVRDLEAVVQALPEPLLFGWSWGAMLALAYAAEHPVGGLFLIGCGTFDEDARAVLRETRAGRLGDLRPRTYEEWGAAAERTDNVDLLPSPDGPGRIDAVAGEATWADMIRLQTEGLYPAAFASIRCPVALVYGDFDPHPGPLVRESLRPVLPQLEYAEIARCGHIPWRERHGRDAFLRLLGGWVDRRRIIP